MKKKNLKTGNLVFLCAMWEVARQAGTLPLALHLGGAPTLLNTFPDIS